MYGALALLTVGAMAGLSGCSKDDSDPFKLTVGQCLPKAASGLIEKVDTVECAQPHTAEVFASLKVDDAKSYPGDEEMKRQAGGCAAKFEPFIGKPYNESDLEITYFHPTKQSWGQGDRQILCVVSVPTGTVKGSLKGSSR